MKRLGLLLLVSTAALSQPFPQKDVPPTLQQWVAWALDGHEDRLCPVLNDKPLCLWPGRVAIAVGKTGGTFALGLTADKPLFAALPGDAKTWPQDVRVDGQAAPVVDREGIPSVWLTAGPHKVDGRLTWPRMPDSLMVPAATALVDVSVDGRDVAFPKREENGLLLLRQEGADAKGEEELRLKVFRKVNDGIPLFLETLITFEVSGKAREVRLVGALVPASVPVSVRGDLPARLDAERALKVQVRPGKFGVTVVSRLEGNPTELKTAKGEDPWPSQEVWTFQSNETLRQVEISGAPGIDASRTELPEEWKKLPTYLIEGAATLKLREARRGEPDPAPDQISLSRTLWLDLDGKSFTAQDQFGGAANRTTRLNVVSPAVLGRVAVNGQDQLVTADPVTKGSGVELRDQTLNVSADSRAPRTGEARAVGWETDVQSLRGTLHLPPGYRLFAARGVDRAPGSWTAQWTLFGFFFVLLVSIAVGKLLGPAWGGVALVTLVLCYREPGAPLVLWISLVAATALVRVAKEGKLAAFGKLWWGGTLALLVIVSVPFFVKQVRHGLFPATDDGSSRWSGGFLSPRGSMAMKEAPPPPMVAEEAPYAAPEGGDTTMQPPPTPEDKPAAPAPKPYAGKKGKKAPERQMSQSFSAADSGNIPMLSNRMASSAPPQKMAQRQYEQDPNALIQTGAGVPSWSWRSQSLEWSGPVAKDHTMRLFLIGPFGNLVLALLRVGLVALLAVGLVRRELPRFRVPGAAIALLLALLVARPLEAQEKTRPEGAYPGSELLDELAEKLSRKPPCAPNCVTTADVTLSIEGTELRIAAEVHAGANVAWPLPGPASSWVPRRVTVDKQETSAISRQEDDFLYLRLAPGVHRVEVSGPLPPSDSLALQFSSAPKRVRATAPGWQVDGLRDDGGTDGSLQLTRLLKSKSSGESTEGVYEPWLEVSRSFSIGVAWRAETVVRRISPAGAPVVVKVPLLKGMLATSDQQVKDGEVLITLGRDQMEERWSSTLKPEEGQELVLKAAEGRPWSEVWTIATAPVWQVTTKGLPPVRRSGGIAEFRPWPGESLSLTFRRPAGVPGQTLTIDALSVTASPGTRLLDATVQLSARASRSTPLTLTLPKGADVQSITVNGQPKPIRPDDTKLTVTVEAGRQQIAVAFRQKEGLALVQRVPVIGLSQEAVNTTVTMNLPRDRWLLFASGPRWGPSLLFWGYLIVIVLTALLLARLPFSPIGAGAWALLAIGFAPMPIVCVLIVATWFFLLVWKKERPIERPVLHNLVQIGLVFATLVFAGVLYAGVYNGLLAAPDMSVTGNGSTATALRWYQDRVAKETPLATAISVPLWVYKVGMLVWSLWLAGSLVKWTGWAWKAFTVEGVWKSRPRPPQAPPATGPQHAPHPPPPPPPPGPVPPFAGEPPPIPPSIPGPP